MTELNTLELGTLARRWLDANAKLDEARDEVENLRHDIVEATGPAFNPPIVLCVDDERIEVRSGEVRRLAYVKEIKA